MQGSLIEKYEHLGAVGEITEMLYYAKDEKKIAHLGAMAEITEMLYFALHEE